MIQAERELLFFSIYREELQVVVGFGVLLRVVGIESIDAGHCQCLDYDNPQATAMSIDFGFAVSWRICAQP